MTVFVRQKRRQELIVKRSKSLANVHKEVPPRFLELDREKFGGFSPRVKRTHENVEQIERTICIKGLLSTIQE